MKKQKLNFKEIQLRAYGSKNSIPVNIEENKKDIIFGVIYEDHGDEFLCLFTKDKQLVYYGCYANRNNIYPENLQRSSKLTYQILVDIYEAEDILSLITDRDDIKKIDNNLSKFDEKIDENHVVFEVTAFDRYEFQDKMDAIRFNYSYDSNVICLGRDQCDKIVRSVKNDYANIFGDYLLHLFYNGRWHVNNKANFNNMNKFIYESLNLNCRAVYNLDTYDHERFTMIISNEIPITVTYTDTKVIYVSKKLTSKQIKKQIKAELNCRQFSFSK